MMKKSVQLAALLFVLIAYETSAQTTDALRQKLQQIISTKNAVVGVSIIANNGKDTLSLHGNRHCPTQSVFKFHAALAVLDQIDKGKFSLDQKVAVQKKDLLPGFWSPLREENPDGGSFAISKLIQYAVSQSDNVACDALLRLLGGPQVVEGYIRENGIKDISLKFNEEDMQAQWDNMFQNWTTPIAASETLRKFYDTGNQLLSPKSYAFIWRIMKETTTGEGRLKGLLPKGTIVAHKTGSSGTNKEGLTPATNDIGIVFLPNGNYFIISVFVANSTENDQTNERIIAEIAKATWDHYATAKK
nr:class A beta-lactamase, subclass A2 [Spirosoma montaniterrae]